jgi:hypothetical protein
MPCWCFIYDAVLVHCVGVLYCQRGDLNPYSRKEPDPKSGASANSATSARGQWFSWEGYVWQEKGVPSDSSSERDRGCP